MKKSLWNKLVFLLYITYCIFYIIIFWCVFDNNDLFHKYYDITHNFLLISVVINTFSQILAIIKKKYSAIAYLFFGILLFLFTIAFTIGQSA